MKKFPESKIKSELKRLPSWKYSKAGLGRSLKFRSFVEAFAFMTAVAMEAEKLNHHPDWSNSWTTVKIALKTHSEKGITALDFKLAQRIEELATKFGGDA